jgi:hypothetical protein
MLGGGNRTNARPAQSHPCATSDLKAWSTVPQLGSTSLALVQSVLLRKDLLKAIGRIYQQSTLREASQDKTTI